MQLFATLHFTREISGAENNKIYYYKWILLIYFTLEFIIFNKPKSIFTEDELIVRTLKVNSSKASTYRAVGAFRSTMKTLS